MRTPMMRSIYTKHDGRFSSFVVFHSAQIFPVTIR